MSFCPGRLFSRRAHKASYSLSKIALGCIFLPLLCFILLHSVISYFASLSALELEIRQSLQAKSETMDFFSRASLQALKDSIQEESRDFSLRYAFTNQTPATIQEILASWSFEGSGYPFDIVAFYREQDQTIMDLSSPLHKSKPLLEHANCGDPQNSNNQWRFVYTPSSPESSSRSQAALLLQTEVIGTELSRVQGYLCIGFLLNNHFTLLRPLKRSSGVKALALFHDDMLLAEEGFGALGISEDILKTVNQLPFFDVFKDSSPFLSTLPISLDDALPLLRLVVTLPKTAFTHFEENFRDSSLLTASLAVLTAAFALLFFRRTVVPSMSHLMTYAQTVRENPVPEPYHQGLVHEYNLLGETLEVMVKEIHDNRDHLQNMLDILPVGIGIVDPSGQIIYRNKMFVTLFGYDEHDVSTISEWLLKAYPEEQYRQEAWGRWLLALEKAQKNDGAIAPDVYHIVTKQDQTLTVEIAEILLGTDVLATFIDLTEKKAAEAELKRSNADLQQFAYVASHDLLEPLRMVSSYLALLRRRYAGDWNEEATEFMTYALEGADRMGFMVKDLLDYSRVQTQGKDLSPEDPALILQNALHNLEIAIEESEAEITIGALPACMADPSQLLRLFQNLVGNALKYRNQDIAPKITITAQPCQDKIHFTISDNGIGIAPEFHERIFMVFQRLHKNEDYSGTGIGLAICKRIVERHGGQIWLESTPTVGSCFHFTLPKAF